jgi:hypothetical protein
MMPKPFSIRRSVPNGRDRALTRSRIRRACSGGARIGEPAAGPELESMATEYNRIAVVHEGLPCRFTVPPRVIRPSHGCTEQIRISLGLADKLVGTGVVMHCEAVKF